ncbi:hypothetical protein KUCAC02_036920 [Chaenocephalus aceratus]|nr:hypothetical protein KUCAC02_036920 [Chaenocephalus aceratus]
MMNRAVGFLQHYGERDNSTQKDDGLNQIYVSVTPSRTEKPLRVQAMVDPHRLLLSEIRHFLPQETRFRSNCLRDVLQIWCKRPAESSLIPTATSCWVALGAETHSGGSSRQGQSTVLSVDSSSPVLPTDSSPRMRPQRERSLGAV